MSIGYEHLDDVLRDEAKYSDDEYRPWGNQLDINQEMFRMYSRPEHMWEWRERAAQLLGPFEGKRLLDLGCGMGEEMVYFAKLGAHVTGIDISEVGVSIAKKRAEHHGLSDRMDPRLMRMDELSQFSDGSFDCIHGLGILHHVDLDHVITEVRRLLKPSGTAVFLEPMGNSPVVESVKDWLAAKSNRFTATTEHERVLDFEQLEPFRQLFSTVELYPYHLLYRARKFMPNRVWATLKRIDHQILKHVPRLDYFAGAVVIKLVK